MKLFAWLFLAAVSFPLITHAVSKPEEVFFVYDKCNPVCRGESPDLVGLYDKVRAMPERTNGPCGPQAVAIAAAKMCRRADRVESLIDHVEPRYVLVNKDGFHVGMAPEDVARNLNLVFAASRRGCPSRGYWKYIHADDLDRTVSEAAYMGTLRKASQGVRRVAAALVQSRDEDGNKNFPHWMVVLRVSNVDYVRPRRVPRCYVTVQDSRGQGEIPCENFYAMAKAVLDYPLVGTTFGIVWFDRDNGTSARAVAR